MKMMMVLTVWIILATTATTSSAAYIKKLALQWPPGKCLGNHDCKRALLQERFLIHGLWLAYDCKTGPALDVGQVNNIPNLSTVWPNLWAEKLDLDFWEYEWTKHGRCVQLTTQQYFTKAISLFNQYDDFALNLRDDAGIFLDRRYTVKEFIWRLKSVGSPEITCREVLIPPNDELMYYLTELRFCINEDASGFKNCDRVVLGAGCPFFWHAYNNITLPSTMVK